MTIEKRQILLKYSSEDACLEHRSGLAPPSKLAAIPYLLMPAEDLAKKHAGARQARLLGRTVWKPDVHLREDFSVKAVIDKMIILVGSRDGTSWSGIKTLIDPVVAPTHVFVQDVGSNAGNLGVKTAIIWPRRALGPETPGMSFAILIQEPTPTKLADILNRIRDRYGIRGDVHLWQLELALDFYPDRHKTEEERLALREQMVGLLQRHHWVDIEGQTDPKADARQVYLDAVSEKTVIDYLFSQKKGTKRNAPDTDIANATTRERLAAGKAPNELYLDATLYRGSELEGMQIRVQHKISDQRNKAAGTSVPLDNTKRRARIEVELTGQQRLETYGLKTVNDLAAANFRHIRNDALQFWLPTSGEDEAGRVSLNNQMQHRGIYGTELMLRLQEWEANTVAPARRSKPARQGTGSAGRRIAWEECNAVVGDALDALKKKWSAFRW
jgi:hypothetical protein